MKYASFFSGLEGFGLALDAAGFQRVFSCEIDLFCNKIQKARFGRECDSKDITTLKPAEIPDADLWVAGFPCQDTSTAGYRGGIYGKRSGLVWRLLELAQVRRPRWIWLENVPGLLSSGRGRDFTLLLREMGKIGYVGCWRVLDARFFGVPQKRSRIFVIGRLGTECPLEVLFEPKNGTGDSPKSSQKGKIASEEIARCVGGVSGGQDYGAGKGTLIAQEIVTDVVQTVPKSSCGCDGQDDYVIVQANSITASMGHHGYSSPRGDGSDNIVMVTRDDDDLSPRVHIRMGLRRLTPTECERLQGFPDGFTCLCGVRPDCPDRRIPPWVDPGTFMLSGCGHSTCGCKCPDSPRYRSLGNAVAVPVIRWIADRLIQQTNS